MRREGRGSITCMDFGLAIALGLASLIGLCLGLLGSGGSIVTMPVLVYVAAIPARQAVGMSLAIVGATSALGTWLRFRRGQLALKAAGFFAVSGAVGALLGAKLTPFVSDSILMLLFGLLMLTVGLAMFRRPELQSAGRRCDPARCLAAGLAVGVLTGFLGVGGGFLILPALVLLAAVPMDKAIGTSLAIIAFNCFAGLTGHVESLHFNWPVTLGFVAAAVLGMLAGLALAQRVSSHSLQRAFAWSILAIGAALCAWNMLHVLS
jgi:uncharacterized protein